jgi:hypothetical protein
VQLELRSLAGRDDPAPADARELIATGEWRPTCWWHDYGGLTPVAVR